MLKKIFFQYSLYSLLLGTVLCVPTTLQANTRSTDTQALDSAEPNRQTICEKFKNTPFPKQDKPSLNTLKKVNTLKQCDSESLYYGIGQPADPIKARECAYYEMALLREEEPFQGKSMLMTIYANGKGADRNFDLAIKLACEIDAAPAETDGRVVHLWELKQKNGSHDDFSICDDITSGLMAGLCAAHEERIENAHRTQQITALQSKWTNQDKAIFKTLEDAKSKYFSARADNEIDLSGTARGAFYIEEVTRLKNAFISSLEKFQKGEFPNFTHPEYLDADSKLNVVYQKIQAIDKTQFSDTFGTITQIGIKNTQIAWIKYRDAWVTFARVKYPNLNEESIKTWLTLDRIKQLEEFLANNQVSSSTER